MYYEERIFVGMLHYRASPDGEWKVCVTDGARAVNVLLSLTPDERVAVFQKFCTSCGSDDPSCQCWNDE